MSRSTDPVADEHVDGVLVVGGGYAGLHAARAAAQLGAPVTVVDEDGRHDFVTRLAGVAGGAAAPTDAGRPLHDFVEHVVLARLTGVADGRIELDGRRPMSADAVVVTTGARPAPAPIPGLASARRLRTADDALRLRDAIAAADSLVIVGGGATGVQLAGSAAAAHPGLAIHLVDAEPRLLAGLPASLAGGAARILSDRGVTVHLGRPVDRITRRSVHLGGDRIVGLVVWAGGYVADATHLGVDLADDGRIVVDDALRIAGSTRTFAAGDVAAHVDRHGRPMPMSAQTAVRAGTIAGRNAARVATGDAPRPARLDHLGWVVDLGGRRGVARLGPVDLTLPLLDRIPPIVHDVIDLRNLLEIGGVEALRFAPSSIRALVPGVPRPPWVGCADRRDDLALAG